MEGVQTSLLLLLVGGILVSSNYTTTYHGHQLWRIQRAGLNISSLGTKVDLWGGGDGWVDARVPPNYTNTLAQTLHQQGVNYTVTMSDIQSVIEAEREAVTSLPKRRPDGRIETGTYHQWEDIEDYLQELSAVYPWLSITSIGQTAEGRELWVAKIEIYSYCSKPTVWIDCGTHAEEWIAPATCIYGLDYLTNGYECDPYVTNFLNKYNVHIMPVHNPDGYYYSWHSDRLWRKNRNRNPNDTCYGVDLGQNYDDGLDLGRYYDDGYRTEDSCSKNYEGPTGFSELETQAVRDYINELQSTRNLAAFFTIHSYLQLWLYAYGWSGESVPEEPEVSRVAQIGVNATESVHNTQYRVGSFYNLVHPVFGLSIDWSYSRGVIYSYVLVLRDKDEYGILLPLTQIVPTGEETWAGLIAAVMAI